MRNAGLNTINSELAIGQCCDPGWGDRALWWSDPFVHTDTIRMAEENHTSWLTHINSGYIGDHRRYKEPIDEAGIC